jgi:ribosome-binding protein aMBF1 (putative translation factor)
MECAICGISGKKVRLFEAVSFKEKGIIHICESCSKKENIPLVKRPTTFQLKEAEKSSTQKVYNMLANARRQKDDFKRIKIEKSKRETEDINLKKLVDKNYEKFMPVEKKPRPDLIDNFHWIIMRARRRKKLTQEQLARELSESETAIKMAEQGILPEDDHRLVNKLESFLGINLRRNPGKKPDETREFINEGGSSMENKAPARVIKFDPVMAKNITIADLKRIKEGAGERIEEKLSEETEEFQEKEMLDEEEPEMDFD